MKQASTAQEWRFRTLVMRTSGKIGFFFDTAEKRAFRHLVSQQFLVYQKDTLEIAFGVRSLPEVRMTKGEISILEREIDEPGFKIDEPGSKRGKKKRFIRIHPVRNLSSISTLCICVCARARVHMHFDIYMHTLIAGYLAPGGVSFWVVWSLERDSCTGL